MHLVCLVYYSVVGLTYQRDACVLGSLLCAALCTLTLRRTVGMPTLEGLGVLLGVYWLLVDIMQDLIFRRPLTLYVVFDLCIVGLLAFTWLPLRRAIWLSGLCFLLTTTAHFASGANEPPALILGGVMLALTGYISEYGRQLSVQRAQTAWLHELAFQDPLTGIASRRSADAYLEQLPAYSQAALLMLDVDHFKAINDTLGHLQGDVVLQKVAQALRASIRQQDMICRWGGEEFLVILRDLTPEQARHRAEELRAAAQQAVSSTQVTLSAGGVMLDDFATPHEALRLADTRLYAAKKQGRDRAVWE